MLQLRAPGSEVVLQEITGLGHDLGQEPILSKAPNLGIPFFLNPPPINQDLINCINMSGQLFTLSSHHYITWNIPDCWLLLVSKVEV